MKNILYLHAGAEMYGADKVLLELLSGLDKNKINPIVILPCEGVLVDALRKEGITTEVIPYPILRRKYFNVRGLINYVRSYLKYSKQIVKYIKDKDISLLHINTTAVLEGIYIKNKLKVPLIWHVHEIIVKPKIIYKFISMLVGKYSECVVTVSLAVKQHLIDSKMIIPEKIKIIYNGVNTNVFNPHNKTEYLKEELSIPDSGIVAGMIGRVNSWKGQNDFLDAMEIILSRHESVYAVMVGGVFEGEEWRMTELKSRINLIEHKDRIRLLDFRPDTPNIHNLFDIFVLPSTNPDPLPTVVLEAMASGKPVVGYRHGGVCEMVKDEYNGMLADVRNYGQLADKIEILIKDRYLRVSMGENSRKRQSELFSVKSYIENFEKLYDESL